MSLTNILYNVELEDLEEVETICTRLLEDKQIKDGTKKVFETLKDNVSYRINEIKE